MADGEMEEAYFAAHPEKELVIPPSIGGAQSLYIRFEADQYVDDCVKAISATYNAKRQKPRCCSQHRAICGRRSRESA